MEARHSAIEEVDSESDGENNAAYDTEAPPPVTLSSTNHTSGGGDVIEEVLEDDDVSSQSLKYLCLSNEMLLRSCRHDIDKLCNCRTCRHLSQTVMMKKMAQRAQKHPRMMTASHLVIWT